MGRPSLPGVPSVEEYTAAGLYEPANPAHSGRVELLDWLTEQGFTVAEIQRWVMCGSVSGVAGDRRLVPGERHDRSVALARSGVPAEEFDAISLAVGFVPIHGAAPGEVGYTDAEIDAIGALGALGAMFADPEVLALLRVIGGSLTRIAEAAVSLFLSEVEGPHLRAGLTELELARKIYEGAGLVDGLAALLNPLLRRQIQQSIERTRLSSIDAIERLNYRYAVGFVDLVGFTAHSGGLPTAELASFLGRFEAEAHAELARHGARVVKFIGDEVMFVATDPAAACAAALGLVEVFTSGLDGVVPRGGLAYGEVLLRSGDYYGTVVNLASRLVDLAVPMEVLVSEPLADAATECTFEPAGKRLVKGFEHPITVRSLVAVPLG